MRDHEEKTHRKTHRWVVHLLPGIAFAFSYCDFSAIFTWTSQQSPRLLLAVSSHCTFLAHDAGDSLAGAAIFMLDGVVLGSGGEKQFGRFEYGLCWATFVAFMTRLSSHLVIQKFFGEQPAFRGCFESQRSESSGTEIQVFRISIESGTGAAPHDESGGTEYQNPTNVDPMGYHTT